VFHRELGLVTSSVINVYNVYRTAFVNSLRAGTSAVTSAVRITLLRGGMSLLVLGAVAGTYVVFDMYMRGNTMREVWEYVAKTDLDVVPNERAGDGGEFRAVVNNGGVVVRVPNELVREPERITDEVAMRLLEGAYDEVGTTHFVVDGANQLNFPYQQPTRSGWREQLLNFMEQIGMPALFVNKFRAKIAAAKTVRRAGLKLLHFREQIFLVRSVVHSRLGREALAIENDATRLIVSRTVNEVMTSLKLNLNVSDMIREACINACFIDTMYDAAGKQLRLGPPRRPV